MALGVGRRAVLGFRVIFRPTASQPHEISRDAFQRVRNTQSIEFLRVQDALSSDFTLEYEFLAQIGEVGISTVESRAKLFSLPTIE